MICRVLSLLLVLAPTVAMGAGTSLKEAAAGKGRLLGSAIDGKALVADGRYRQILADQFNVATPENAFKFDVVQPAPGRFNFAPGDRIADFAKANNMQLRGHTLAWYQALPSWLTARSYSREELIAILRDHIHAVVGHYKGRVHSWDVVNEVFEADGSFRSSIWYDGIGPEYIAMAFRWAREADPDALLFYNDFDTEIPGPKSDALFLLLKDLKGKGVPVDGVGFQAHIFLEQRPALGAFISNLKRFAQLGLQTDITELDVSVLHVPERTSPKVQNEQADVFADVVRACSSVSSCKMIVLWGFTDKYTWKRRFDARDAPLPYDVEYNPKPAYEAIVKAFK